MLHRFAAIGLSLALTSCTSPEATQSAKAGSAVAKTQPTDGTPAAAEKTSEQIHDVVCGCTLKEVGHCGEYIKKDDKFVELELPAESKLGGMPFCGKRGLKAKVDGEMKGDKFVASSFEFSES